MVKYNFKKIRTVPDSSQFIDIVLSKTQKKTPTVIHKGYAITRIKEFYMRKVKFVQQTFHERLSMIIDDFPVLDDIHPFYGDLMNILYHRDHYKLALGQLNTARTLIDNLSKEYTRMLKFGDSLYRCKQLKRAAVGRMCTLIRKHNSALNYLEQVRQHLSRLPVIDPTSRTLLVCGYPNVGKSSFMNKITRANVDVQPYPFTTKSLFVGHFDYNYLRWQAIDTPGILDHPLEERNTIEMQSITAMAHLKASILFFIDISEHCGFTIKDQIALFKSIKTLFTGKPLIIVLSKIDLLKPNELKEKDRKLIESLIIDENQNQNTNENENENEDEIKMDVKVIWESESGILYDGDQIKIVCMSSLTETGITLVKSVSCDLLMAQRIETKTKMKKMTEVANRLHVSFPKQRDNKQRPPQIPESVLNARQNPTDDEDKPKKILERDLEKMFGGAGLYNVDLNKYFILENEDWRYDVVPEIIDGKNISDFVDPDILKRLDELEIEEEEIIRRLQEEPEEQEGLTEEQEILLSKIREKRTIMHNDSKIRRRRHRKRIPRNLKPEKTVEQFESHLQNLGIENAPLKEAKKQAKKQTRGRTKIRKYFDEEPTQTEEKEETQNKRERSLSQTRSKLKVNRKSRPRSKSLIRSTSVTDPKTQGVKSVNELLKVEKLSWNVQKIPNKLGKKGYADHAIYDTKPKHLFSGKRSSGKTDWR